MVVHIPFANGLNLTFGYIKVCTMDGPPKLSIVMRGVGSDGTAEILPVFLQGKVDSSFDGDGSLAARFESKLNTTHFVLRPDGKASVTLGAPKLTLDNPGANPILKGAGAKGATIDKPLTLAVQHNCHMNVGTGIPPPFTPSIYP